MRLLPLVLFFIVTSFLAFKIVVSEFIDKEETSHLIGKQIPQFSLPLLFDTQQKLSDQSFKDKYVMINFFASWCASCAQEHQTLRWIKDSNIAEVYGIAWKDEDSKTKEWLVKFGNVYADVAIDNSGRTGIDFGVTGTPETFLIDQNGKIIYKHTGILDQSTVKKQIIPKLQANIK